MPDPVTGVIAGTSLISGGMASSSASSASKRAAQASAESLAFEKERYDDWLEVYGPMQTNLAEYYGSLTPEYYETMGLEAFEQEQQTAMTRIDESLAQRGIDPSSGISASLHAQSELEGAEGRAEIRRDAPRMAAEDKSRFLQIGLGQNPAESLSRTMSNQASAAQQRATQSEQAAGRAMGQAVQTAGTALVDYLDKPQAGDT